MSIGKKLSQLLLVQKSLTDEDLPDSQLHQRERSIAADISTYAKDDQDLVANWHLHRFGKPAADSGVEYLPVWAALAGFFGGCILMLGLLSYQGDLPVNIFLVLGLFVVLQVLLMLLQIVAVLTKSSPLSLLTPLLSRLPAKSPANVTALLNTRVLFWLNQWAALAFAVAAAMTLLILITFQDIAFGWSTTLDLATEPVHQVIAWLSSPWHRLWPEALPSYETVQATRFFRLDFEVIDEYPKVLWGGWWKFLLMAISCYVIVPRLLLLWWFRYRLIHFIDGQYQLPPIANLLFRLRNPVVHTGEQVREVDKPAFADRQSTVDELPQTARFVLFWACDDELVQAVQGRFPEIGRMQLHRAGGRQSILDDAAIREVLASASGRILLVTAGWEPPREELRDFLLPLANRLDGIALVALTLDSGVIADPEHTSWRHFLERLPGKPGLWSLGALN